MQIRKSHIKNSLTKTLLIILGVIIALIMTMNSPLFSAESLFHEEDIEGHPSVSEAQLKNEETSSGGVNYNSGTRLFHIFTENLPYLNNK